MPTYIVLLGPPGGGKGTQAKRIVEEFSTPQVSTGDLFRAMKTQNTPLAHRVQEIMANGNLVPDDITVHMVKGRLVGEDCKQGAILDGFPRTIAQAEALDDMLDRSFASQVAVVLLLNISEEEAVRRISGRRSCPMCNRVYHIEFDPPQRDNLCNDDDTELVQRADDKPETVRERYQVYQEKTEPLIDYYRDKELLVEVSADQPIEAVTAELLGVIRRYVRAD